MAERGWVAIDERTWRYEEGNVRFFLLAGEEDALLIDSGQHTTNARELAEELLASQGLDLPVSLVNTHADGDHTASNPEFDEFYMSPAELVNYKYPCTPQQVIAVFDGDVIELGGRDVEVVGIPGHTPGSIGLLDVASGMLFSGDPIQTGDIYMFGTMRNMVGYVLGLRALEPVLDDVKSIWPSHATCPVETSLSGQLADAAERILRGEMPYELREVHGTRVRAYDVGIATFLCDDK